MSGLKAASAVAAALLSTLPELANGAPLDLSSWSALTLDFPGGQPAGNWVLDSGNTAVTQTVNADPSFFLNNSSQTSYTIQGTWQVGTSADDDYMGFVFGYQNSSNFYLFDWKQISQTYVGTNAAEGMTIKKFTGATANGLVDLSLEELWENEQNLGDMTVLAMNHASTAGWADNTLYTFQLDFNVTPGQFRVRVSQGASVLWDTTVDDSTFTAGQFGFYNYSQQNVRYAGFEQEVVPEPGVLALLGSAAVLLASSRRLRRGLPHPHE